MNCGKSAILLVTFSFLSFNTTAQVPLKVWDQVIGTKEADADGGNKFTTSAPATVSYYTGANKGFKLIKMPYGLALIFNNFNSSKSGNIITDDNPGNKLTGIVAGFNHDGTKKFDKRFLASGNGAYSPHHYTLFNYETFIDAIPNGNNLIIAGHMGAGTGNGNSYTTVYEVGPEGGCIYGQKLYDAYYGVSDVFVGQVPVVDPNLRTQTFLFTHTASSGGVNLYVNDDGRTSSYNLNCFKGPIPYQNLGFLRRESKYTLDEAGFGATNNANIMGESGYEHAYKILSNRSPYFFASNGTTDFSFIVAASIDTQTNRNCFFQTQQKGQKDLLVFGVDEHLNKKFEFRIGAGVGESVQLYDFEFLKDGNFLFVLTGNNGDFSTPINDANSVRLYKCNKQGLKIWEKVVSVGFPQTSKVSPTSDGGFFIVSSSTPVAGTYPRLIGSTYPNRSNPGSASDILIQKFDANGSRVWDYRFGSEAPEGFRGSLSMVDLGNDEYAFACDADNSTAWKPVSGDRSKDSIGGQTDIWLLKFKNYPARSIVINGTDKQLYFDGIDTAIKITYTLPSNYNAGNAFYIEISNANGNFVGNRFGPIFRQSSGELELPLQIRYGRLGNKYKVRVSSTEPRDTSLIYEVNFAASACAGSSTFLFSSIVGGTYQWQVNDGTGFTDIFDNTNYSGVNSQALQINNLPSTWSGYLYRCLVDGTQVTSPITVRVRSVWTGAVDNTWENPGNWDCGHLPDDNTDVLIKNSGTTLMVNSNQSVKSLSLQLGAKIQVTTGFNLNVVGK